ncbi:MAG: hypothetical protein B7Y59_12640 [Burkholderiales bacterium 35-55-47]|jgi:hypothetical protein|nr:MAG: hypothetical protein B7Y59_12640 [Burkholderiales bacterium 35-55-47]OZA98923.1 MAG: hypothetical protein B7X62_12625 [Burkholderiales bacterium 39-55-53]
MILERLFEMGYKGDRNYIHGSDIFNETISWLILEKKDIRDIDFMFHRFAYSQLMAIVGSTPPKHEIVATCTFTSSVACEKVYLTETIYPVISRRPYPEDEMLKMMDFNLSERRVLLHGENSFSDIEQWVALTKALHYKLFPKLSGKWIFVRGRFPDYFSHSKCQERSIIFVSEFNYKLTRCDALRDGTKVGEIYFSII